MERKKKLGFLQSIAEQERNLDQEISLEIKSIVQNLQQLPKTHYSLRDFETMIDRLKVKMQSLLYL